MNYENDNEERRLFDQIMLQLVSCGSNEPPERIATRVIDARRAYFVPTTALESRPSIDALNMEIGRQRGVIRSQNNDIARMQERIAELESRPDAAEMLQRVLSQYEGKGMPAGECELLRDIARRLASLTGPKKPTKPVDHVHELGSCTHCDAKPQACAGCGGTGVDLNQQCCFECSGKGYL